LTEQFQTHARLAADSFLLEVLPLCDVRLMNEARWAWLILVPRIAGAEEIFDLTEKQRAILAEEINFAAELLSETVLYDKINIGALGNIVRQMHIHIVARRENDAAWPNPVWGQGARQDMSAAARQSLEMKLKAAFAAHNFMKTA